MLQGRLSRSANHGLVCGVTSCTEGEGRSTWIQMLAEAASHAGFRVLTIATKPSPSQANGFEEEPDALPMPDQVVNESQQSPAGPLAANVLLRLPRSRSNSPVRFHSRSFIFRCQAGCGTWNAESNGARRSTIGVGSITW